MRFLAALLLLGAAPLAGCVNTDTSIFVTPTISSPAATVMSSALGTGITGGSFSLDLHLGPRAEGPSTVTLGEFSILDAQEKTTIVSPLDVSADMQFPVILDPGSDVMASFTFGTGSNLLMPSVEPELCASAGVVIGGTINDSLAAKSTPMYTGVFHPSGCP